MLSVKSPRLRLVVLDTSAAMGGVQHSTLNLLRYVDQTKLEPILFCSEEGDLPEAARGFGVEVRIVPIMRIKSSSCWKQGIDRIPNPFAWIRNAFAIIGSARCIAKELRNTSAQLLLTKGLPSHFSGGLAAKLVGIPCVWHMQDFISERHRRLNIRVTSYFAKSFMTDMIVDGTAIKDQYPRTLQHRIQVVLNAVDTDVFSPRSSKDHREAFGIPEEAVVIGHAARITPWKGQMELLRAFQLVASKRPLIHLLIVGAPIFDGDQYYNLLRFTAAQSEYHDRIHFAGYQKQLASCLRAMDIFAYPSLEKDTSPLSLLSALSTGLPIVGFDIPGVREVVTQGKEGSLVPTGDIASFADELLQVIDDDQKREKLRQAARAKALTHFSMQQHVSDVQNFLLRYSPAMNGSVSNGIA